MIRRCQFGLLLLFFAGTSLSVVAQTGDNEWEQQRRRYDLYRQHPDRLARLRENYQSYQSLLRKEAVTKLDQEMHALSEKKQARYWGVLSRYADWLDQLKKKNPQAYQAIKDAPDAASRLTLIKSERDREWMQTQPRAAREHWAKLQGDERTEYVANLRIEERHQRLQWQIAARFWREIENKQFLPCRLSDFSQKAKGAKFKEKEMNKVQEYVTNYLLPYLSDAEKKQLEDADGRWPDFPQALVEIARKRPSALPPAKEEDIPTLFSQLPAPIQDRVTDKKGGGVKAKLLKEIRTFEKSPGFAGKVVELGTNKGSVPFEHEFWPSHFKGLQKPMQTFVLEQLIPKLDSKDKIDLEDHQGRWPYYPKKIQELARKHNLQPPWHILPEPDVWHWDRYRRDRQNAPIEKSKDDMESP
jgi:hypothetical protein